MRYKRVVGDERDDRDERDERDERAERDDRDERNERERDERDERDETDERDDQQTACKEQPSGSPALIPGHLSAIRTDHCTAATLRLMLTTWLQTLL